MIGVALLRYVVLAVLIILGHSRSPPGHRPEQTVAWRGLEVGLPLLDAVVVLAGDFE